MYWINVWFNLIRTAEGGCCGLATWKALLAYYDGLEKILFVKRCDTYSECQWKEMQLERETVTAPLQYWWRRSPWSLQIKCDINECWIEGAGVLISQGFWFSKTNFFFHFVRCVWFWISCYRGGTLRGVVGCNLYLRKTLQGTSRQASTVVHCTAIFQSGRFFEFFASELKTQQTLDL